MAQCDLSDAIQKRTDLKEEIPRQAFVFDRERRRWKAIARLPKVGHRLLHPGERYVTPQVYIGTSEDAWSASGIMARVNAEAMEIGFRYASVEGIGKPNVILYSDTMNWYDSVI